MGRYETGQREAEMETRVLLGGYYYENPEEVFVHTLTKMAAFKRRLSRRLQNRCFLSLSSCGESFLWPLSLLNQTFKFFILFSE